METSLFNILRGYAALIPPDRLETPSGLASSTIHSFFLDNLLLSEHFVKYPPSDQYQRTFWKWGIRSLESLELDETFEEIDPRIYEHYLSLLPSSGIALGTSKAESRTELCPGGLELRKPPSSSYVTHYWAPNTSKLAQATEKIDIGNLRTTTLHESRTMIEHGTTGMRTWLASFVLAEYLAEHPELLQTNSILELGSGIGFLGIRIGQLQQSKDSNEKPLLWLSDVNEGVLSRCQENIELPCNQLDNENIRCVSLDWFDALDRTKQEELKKLIRQDIDANLILGADIIFDPSLIPPLAEILSIALQPGANTCNQSAIIAATIRNEDTFAKFLDEVKDKGLQVNELASCRGDKIVQTVDTGDTVKIIQIKPS